MADERRYPVAGAFAQREDADRALTDLHGAGFRDDDIGWAMRHEEAPEGAQDVSGDVASGATAGAVTGGILGGAGAAVGMALIPGIGPFLAGGYLGTILLTAGASAAAGGALGGLAGMFASEDEGKFYENEFRSGRPIMTVNAGERGSEAQEIMRRHGGYDYASRGLSGGATLPINGSTVSTMNGDSHLNDDPIVGRRRGTMTDGDGDVLPPDTADRTGSSRRS